MPQVISCPKCSTRMQVPDDATPEKVTDARGRVEFEHVSFSYDPDKPLITDLSLVAEPGQTVAIVGPTGAGKTTLVNLLMRFYDVDAGSIRVDGTDIRHIRQGEGAGRRRRGLDRRGRGDAQLGEVDFAERGDKGRRREDVDRRLQARPDTLLGAFDFERAGHDAAQIAQPGPALTQGRVVPFRRYIGEQFEVDAAFGVVAITREPGFLGGEAQDRREPAHQAIEGAVEHRARGAAAQII